MSMSQMRAGLVGIVAGTEQVVQMTAEGGDRRGVPNGLVTSAGRVFNARAAATGKARSEPFSFGSLSVLSHSARQSARCSLSTRTNCRRRTMLICGIVSAATRDGRLGYKRANCCDLCAPCKARRISTRPLRSRWW